MRLAAQQLPPEPGQSAPDFVLKSLAGDVIRLADLAGRPVLVNFWASWCKPCQMEMPAIIAAYHAHQEARLAVLAVNLRDQEQRQDVRRFVANLPLPFPVLLDVKGNVRMRHGLIAVPTTVFVDSGGVIRSIQPGPLTEATLSRGLALILP